MNEIITIYYVGYEGVASFTTTLPPIDEGEEYNIIYKLECTGEEESVSQCILQDVEQLNMQSSAATRHRVAKFSCAGIIIIMLHYYIKSQDLIILMNVKPFLGIYNAIICLQVTIAW